MAVKTKNNAKANYIPTNQKHQVISLDQFGAYDYNKRRKQWHKLAGNNEEQEVCSICRDDDNWTSVKLDNGNHVCYFCWVKKPTEEAKKAAATVVNKNSKVGNKLVVADKKKTNIDAEIVEIQKFNDNQGTSYRNKDDVQNYRTSKNTIDKTSKYGVNPSVYYDSQVDYSKPHDEIDVIRPYDKNYLPRASKNAEKKAKDLADEAIREYNNAVTRAKLVTKKNMAIAKVEVLRTLTKAMVIEKNYYERENEIARHQEAIKNIKKLREQLLEKNEVSLEYNLEKLARDNEIELKNNEDDYIKTKIKIEQKAEIIDLKHRQEKEKIRILSHGKDYKKSSIKNEIKQIKNAKYIPQNVDLDSNDDTLAGLIRRVNQIDPSRLSSQERESVSKFLRLVAAYDRENKHQELLAEYKKAIDDMDKKINKTMKKNSKSKKGNEAMIVSYESYKKVINAKKTSLFISEPIKNYEQPEVRTKVIKVKTNSKAMNPSSKTLVKYKPITNGLNKVDYQKVDISSYYDSDIEKTIKKFKRIAQDANRYDDFFVSKHGDSAYKINYEKIKYTKYELRWRHKHKASNDDEGYDVVYKDLYDDDGEKWWSKFTPKKNANGETIPRSYYTLLRKIEHLPSDPLVVENIDITKKERDDIMNEINTLRNMDISPNLTDSQYRDLIKRVDDVTEIYRYLEQKDLKHRRNVMKAQICDEKLSQRIIRDESKIAHAYAKADERYNNREQHINEKYAKNVEYAKNEALLNVERIYENEQESLAREQEQHLWNKASSYEANNKLANDQYKYQNSIIGATVKEIEKFNKKSDTPIVLSDMPHKILPLPVTSNSTININIDKIGSKVMVYSNSSDRRNESAAKAVNDETPINVTKIYVLDKFRNVKDVKTRVALLNEHANREYAKAAEYNIAREKREIENADRKLQQKLKVVDEIYQDSTTLKFAGERMNHIVKERDWVQDHYEKVKAEKWKIHDRDQRLKEKIQKMNEKNQELELIKAQKEANRNKEKLRLTSKRDDELDYQDIIAKK